jgi:hypothetical protein
MTFLRTLTLSLTTLAAASVLGACDPATTPVDASETSAPRGPLGKADKAGSCWSDEADFCGGPSSTGCWCDDACVDYGDCCADVDEACGVEAPQDPGICPDPDDPAVHYIFENPLQCLPILFGCEEGQQGFSDDCGCGCIDVAPEPACPDPDDPSVHYVSTEVLHCAAILFGCEEGQQLFSDECGCGCIDG